MSFEAQTSRTKILKTKTGGKYWIEFDANNQYYRVVQGSEQDYQNNFGAVAYQESFSGMSRDGSNIEPGTPNQTSKNVDGFLKNFGGLAFLNQTRNLVGDAILDGKIGIDDATWGGYTGSFWASESNKADTEVTNESLTPESASPDPGEEGTGASAAIGELTQGLIDANNDAIKNLSIDTNTLPTIAKTLKYPEDLDMAVQDTLVIDTYKYEPARGLPNINEATDNERYLRTGISKNKKPITTIILPIPNAIGDSNAVAWGGGQFSSVAGTLGNEINNAIFGSLEGGPNKGVLDTLRDALATGAGAAIGAARGASELIGNEYVQRKVLLEGLAKAAGQFNINVDVNQVITRTGGVVENPNLELLFSGPSLRSFQFTVRFTPRGPSESKIIRKIIRVLKQHSAAKKGVTIGTGTFSNKNLLIGTPDVFVLKYLQAGTRREIKGLTKMKTCALTGLTVDYTGEAGRWAAYDEDSQPVTTLVTMSFAELAPIYDTDYINAFETDDVGF